MTASGRERATSIDGYQINGLQGAARYGLLNIPQPVASADADFNRAMTLVEFRQAASYRFKLLDSSGQGRLTLAELEERLPTRPKGKRAKPRKDAIDTRVGLPLPEGRLAVEIVGPARHLHRQRPQILGQVDLAGQPRGRPDCPGEVEQIILLLAGRRQAARNPPWRR